jgi:hypothetical protein
MKWSTPAATEAHALDVVAAQTLQVATLADVDAQGLRSPVGLEDAGQHGELFFIAQFSLFVFSCFIFSQTPG